MHAAGGICRTPMGPVHLWEEPQASCGRGHPPSQACQSEAEGRVRGGASRGVCMKTQQRTGPGSRHASGIIRNCVMPGGRRGWGGKGGSVWLLCMGVDEGKARFGKSRPWMVSSSMTLRAIGSWSAGVPLFSFPLVSNPKSPTHTRLSPTPAHSPRK